MAKRTPGLEPVTSVIPRWVHGKGRAFEKKFFAHWVLWHWEDIVGSYNARQAEPQGIRNEVLYLYCWNSVLRNELQMMQARIVDQVNQYAACPLIRGIAFSRRWEQPESDGIGEIRIAHQQEEYDWGRQRKRIALSEKEQREAASLGGSVEDTDIREKARILYARQLQMNRLRKERKWHPCADCGRLCPPEESCCTVCRSRRQEERAAAVRQVLRDIPWARCGEVREYVPDCTPKLLNEQRAAMVQQLASEVDVRDTSSLKARNLVMLYRCLPPEQLTEEEMARTLYRLRFNLHRPKDYKAPKRYSVIPLGKKDRRKS